MRAVGFLAGVCVVAAAIMLLLLNKSIVAGVTPTQETARPATSSGASKHSAVHAPGPAAKSQSRQPASKRSIAAKKPRKPGHDDDAARSTKSIDIEAATPRSRSTDKMSDARQTLPKTLPRVGQASVAEGDDRITDSPASKARQSKESQGDETVHTLKLTSSSPHRALLTEPLAPDNTPATAQVHSPAPGSTSAKPAPDTSPLAARVQWQPFWGAFNTRASAHGFATDVARATGLKIKPVETSSGLYRVAFSYHSELERARRETRIVQRSGLKLMRASSTPLRKTSTAMIEKGFKTSAAGRLDEIAAPATQSEPNSL